MFGKKAQSAIEFMILVGFLLVAFVIFLSIVSENLRDKANERQNLQIKEIALGVKVEVDLAAESSDGYVRSFSIPIKIYGADYDISVNEGFVSINTGDGGHALSLSLANVTGQVLKGENIIRKEDGVVLLNE
jgi:hypothetical protein